MKYRYKGRWIICRIYNNRLRWKGLVRLQGNNRVARNRVHTGNKLVKFREGIGKIFAILL